MALYAESQPNTPKRSPILAEALDAAQQRGYAVFPLSDKVPAIKGGSGHKDASRDPREIISLFTAAAGKSTGYGIRTGSASGVVVVDVDSAQGVAEVKRLGLHSEYVVRTGRLTDGWHLYFRLPVGVQLKGGNFGEHLRCQGDGQFVAGPGSLHPSGNTYRVVLDGDPSPLPPEIVQALDQGGQGNQRPGQAREARGRSRPVNVEVGGPAIPDGERDDSLTRICGRLHDGSRTVQDLACDLDEINQARCQPPLERREVEKIARSIHKRKPCNPQPEVTPWVRAAVEYLASIPRPIKGMGGSTGWAIYCALLERASRYGSKHEPTGGVAVSVDRRTLARLAGTNNSTVTRWIHRTSLVSVARRGSGRRSGLLVLHVPEDFTNEGREGHKLHHLSTSWLDEGTELSRSDANSALHRSLYRLRWSGGSSRARPGLVKGTRKVRQSRPNPYAWDRISRVGKSKGAILWAVVERGAEMSRSELGQRLGRKPTSLRTPLRFLVEIGLLIRVRRGYYDVPEDLVRRLDDIRELGREPQQERHQIAEDARNRAAYHGRNKPQQAEPSPESAENVRRSRERREQHLREQAEREREQASEARERRTPEETREQERRIRRMVYEGWSPTCAEAEVDGLDLEDAI